MPRPGPALLALPLAVTAALAVSGCGQPASADPTPATSSPATLTVRGSVTVDGRTTRNAAANICHTEGGYGDIAYGTQVVISDAGGKTIALGKLGAGSHEVSAQEGRRVVERSVRCTFAFSVDGVPAGQSFYQVEVSHRGAVQYAADDLASPLVLTLR